MTGRAGIPSWELGTTARALENYTLLAEGIPPSPQLLISLIPLQNSADSSSQHSIAVDAVGSLCSDFNYASLHSPQLDCRPFEAMNI